MDNEKKAVLLASVAVLCWATVATAFKMAQDTLTSFGLTFVASVTALVVFSVIMTIRRKWGLVARITVRNLEYFAVIGLVNPAAYYLILMRSYKLLPGQVAQPVNYMWPVVLLVLLAAFAKKPIKRKCYVGMAMSLAGVVIIAMGNSSAHSDAGYDFPQGIGFGFASAVLWATYWMLSNVRKRRDTITFLFMGFLFGSFYLLLLWAFGMDICLPGREEALNEGFLWAVYVGLFEMALPFITFGMALELTSNPTFVNQMCYAGPFLSLFFLSFIRGEEIKTVTYLGLVMIVGGIIYNKYFVKEEKQITASQQNQDSRDENSN